MFKLLSYKYGVCKIGHENWQTWWTQETLCMGFTIFFGYSKPCPTRETIWDHSFFNHDGLDRWTNHPDMESPMWSHGAAQALVSSAVDMRQILSAAGLQCDSRVKASGALAGTDALGLKQWWCLFWPYSGWHTHTHSQQDHVVFW